MNYTKSYNDLLTLIRECNDFLDRKYGFALSGSPILTDSIKQHFKNNPDDDHAIYGLALVTTFEKLSVCITENKKRLEKFMKENR